MPFTSVHANLVEVPIGVFIVDHNWKLCFVNKAAEPSFVGMADHIGRDFDSVMHEMWPPETADFVLNQFKKTRDTGEIFRLEEFSDTRIDRMQREYYDWQLQRSSTADGTNVICYFNNITKHVQTRQAIEESKRQFTDLANAMPQMVWTAGIDGGLEFTNDVIHNYTGVDASAVRGWGFAQVIHDEDVERVKQVWTQALNTGNVYEVDCRIRSHSGDFRWHLIRGVPVRDEQQKIIKWFGTNTDIHNERQSTELLERAVLERTQQLQLALVHAQKANEMKSQFVATVSHEVRTPMSGILGLSEYLSTLPLNPEIREIADHLHLSSKRLMAILNDLLDYSKIEAGKTIMEEVNFSPAQVVSDVAGLFTHLAEQKSVEFVTSVSASVPEAVIGDEQKIRQILTNLVSNAIKFTSVGKIVIALEVVDDTIPSLRYSVSDTGIGIAAENSAFLFEPFSQAETSTSRRFGGSGLGLSICKSYVELLRGEIGFEPNAVSGSKFWFVVPCKKVAEQ